ncbi:hypothetical protein FOS14_07375 [Skermania sp. ID1734]|nr:hypothetical protein FOS14_07375 [Skermania sp. ID1734]
MRCSRCHFTPSSG